MLQTEISCRTRWRLSIQAILRENGSVTINFGAFAGVTAAQLEAATVGMQGPGGLRGLTYRWGSLGGPVAPKTALDFAPTEEDKAGPEVLGITVTPILAGMYEVRARLSDPEGSPIGGAEMWVEGLDMSTAPVAMFSADGGMDSPEEEAVAYYDAFALAEGSYTFHVRAMDSLGNYGEPASEQVTMDRTPPQTICELSKPDGGYDWYRTAPVATCSATDALGGVDHTEYRLNGGDWTLYTAPLTIAGDGSYLLEVRSVDAQGNAELPKYVQLGVDANGPAVEIAGIEPDSELPHSAIVTLSPQVNDSLSGVDRYTVIVDDEYELPAGDPVELWQLPLGTHLVGIRAYDRAGNMSESEPVFFTLYANVSVLAEVTEIVAGRGYLIARPQELQALRDALRKAAEAEANGDRFAARTYMLAYVEQLQDLKAVGFMMDTAYQTLLDDANAVIKALEGYEDCGC